jgi:putative ABC transport system permease protein
LKRNLVSTVINILGLSLGLMLLGLSLFVARRKNKKIGIRKVHGAQSTEIVRMMLKEFIPVIIIAHLIGFPITFLNIRK